MKDMTVLYRSDMVWTPIGQDMSAYFLQFADKDKRYSYAPSMTGCQTFTESDAATIKDFLLDMNEISCREQEGVDYVKQVTGRDATLVIDPTLLFSKEEWRKELSITSLRPKRPYILCYNFGGLPPKIEPRGLSYCKRAQYGCSLHSSLS